MVICLVVTLLWAEGIVGIFSKEPDLVELTGVFLRIAAVGYLGFGLSGVLMECLTGAGDTLPAMLVSLGDLWLVRLPLAFLLPLVTDLGVYGVRWALVIGVVIGAVVFVTYFRMGRWKRRKV